jgi:dihydrofolate reductase
MGLKLVMAVSADGFVARGPTDDMTWTGSTDKRVFRLLTSVGGVLGAGRRTFEQLPKLEGRAVHMLTRDQSAGLTLEEFTSRYPDAWLIGGQGVALEALRSRLLDQAFLCRSREAFLRFGIKDEITPCLMRSPTWQQRPAVCFAETFVDVWENHEP